MADRAEVRIGFSDVFKDDVFGPVLAAAKQLEGTLNTLEKRFAQLAKQGVEAAKRVDKSSQGAAKTLREKSKAVEQAAQATKALDVVEKARERLQRQLIVLESERAKELAEMRIEIKDQAKDLKMLIEAEKAQEKAAEAIEKLNKRQYSSYAELSDILDDLRARYKNLAATNQLNTQEAAELRDAIVMVDKQLKEIDFSVGQFQRNVGNYAASFKEALTDFFSGAGPAGQAVLGLGFAAQRAGDAFRAGGGGVKGFFRALVEGAKALRGIGLLLLLEGLSKLVETFHDMVGGSERIQAAQRALDVTKQEVRLNEQLAAIKTRLDALEEDSLQAINRREELLRRQFAIEQRLAALRVAKAREELQKAQDQAKEAQESFGVRIARALGIAIRAMLNGVATLIQAIGQLAVVLDKDAGKRFEAFSASVRKAGEDVQEFFAGFAAQERVDALQALAEAEKGLSDAMQEQQALANEHGRALEELQKKRDELIKQALEGLEVEVEAERNAREELEHEYAKRIQALRDAYVEAQRVLGGDAQAIAQARLKFEQSLFALETERQRRLAQLLAESRKRLSEIERGLEEQSLKAQLAAIRDKYAAILQEVEKQEQILQEQQADLRARLISAQAREEAQAIFAAAGKRIQLQEQLAEARLEQERIKFDTEVSFVRYRERRMLEIQLEATKQRLEALKVLQQRYTSEELDLQRAQLEAQITQLQAQLKAFIQQAQKEAISQIIQSAQELANAIGSYLQRLEQRQLDIMQRQQAALQRRISVFERAAESGTLAATESIAALEKEEAALVQRQEAIKRQAQRREFALAAIRAYASAVQRGSPNALLDVIKDITALTTLIQSLPTFQHGSENVREGIRIPSAVRDALIVRVEAGERIVPREINRQLQGVPNELLPQLLKSQKVEFDYDSLANALVAIFRRGNKTQISKRAL